MPAYRKKPVVIEARVFDPGEETHARDVQAWCKGVQARVRETHTQEDGSVTNAFVEVLRIPTLEGEMTASPGDYIIRGVAGEFYPCKPDIFAATYEPEIGESDDNGRSQDVGSQDYDRKPDWDEPPFDWDWNETLRGRD